MKNIEVKREEFEKSAKFLSSKFDDETKKISAMDGEVRKHSREIHDIQSN